MTKTKEVIGNDLLNECSNCDGLGMVADPHHGHGFKCSHCLGSGAESGLLASILQRKGASIGAIDARHFKNQIDTNSSICYEEMILLFAKLEKAFSCISFLQQTPKSTDSPEIWQEYTKYVKSRQSSLRRIIEDISVALTGHSSTMADVSEIQVCQKQSDHWFVYGVRNGNSVWLTQNGTWTEEDGAKESKLPGPQGIR